MSDDPVTFLNLQEEPTETGRPGRWWIAAVVAPVGFGGLGILLAYFQGRAHGSLETILLLAIGGVALGALLSVAFAAASLAKQESGRVWAVLAALPCIGLLAWGLALFGQSRINDWHREQAARQRATWLQQIKADPEIGLKEHWGGPGDPSRAEVFRESLRDPGVHYSLDQLQRIYDEMPSMRAAVLGQPGCTAEFLTAHFQAACAEAQRYSYPMLAAIIQHPHTPLPLLESITRSSTLPAGAVREAKYTLDRRTPAPPPAPKPADMPGLRLGGPLPDPVGPGADRFARFRKYEAAASGKYVGMKILSLPLQSLPDGRQVVAPRQTILSVPGMNHLMETKDYRNVYFLPDFFSFEDAVRSKLTDLAIEFAIEHNEKLLKQRGHE